MLKPLWNSKKIIGALRKIWDDLVPKNTAIYKGHIVSMKEKNEFEDNELVNETSILGCEKSIR